jgi:tetratricopeptide (TPR) repeat protein
MSRRIPLFAAVFVLLAPIVISARPPTPAGATGSSPLDPELATPYLWRVVIQAPPHPLLTPTFRDGLRRDLLAALQPALGPLGTVEVVDLGEVPQNQWAPIWQQFVDNGFSALNCDPNRDLTGVKTHLLRVEFRDGKYHLEARQYDGFTGLGSPVVRKLAIQAPELVGRAAGMMIDRDFGVEGTVEPTAGRPDEAHIRFRGGQLGPVDRLVKKGDVFAVAKIIRTNRSAPPAARTATGKLIAPAAGSEPPAALTAEPREFTYLQVAELSKDRVARCTVLSRYLNPFPMDRAAVGYRCLKLTTVQSPVAVRLVGVDGKAATTPVASVRATESGFSKQLDQREFLNFENGVYRTSRPLSGVACVTIALGASKEARFPVPVYGSDPVNLQFEVDAKAEEKALFERAVLAVSDRVGSARYGQAACFDAVAKLTAARKNKEALDRAKAGFEAADTANLTLSEEIRQLRADVDKSPSAANLLDRSDEQLKSLRLTNTRLANHIKELDAVVTKENDPVAVGREVQAQALNARINLLLAGGEVEEALAAYDQLATLIPDNPEVKTRKEKLAAEWKPKDAEHAKARDYLLKTWPALATVQDIKDSLGPLRTATDVCKKAKDKYAFRRFLGILGGFPNKLLELTKDLDPNAAGDLKILQDVKSIGEVAAPLEKDLADFLKSIE